MTSIILELNAVYKSFSQGINQLDIIRGANLSIMSGQIVGLLGPSGSGKSTLLQLAGLLDSPDSGRVFINGLDSRDLKDKDATSIRGQNIGFVYQYHHLLSEFSALENVILPQIILGLTEKEALERSKVLLNKMGLQERMHHRPGTLSGGEQQRVAIARAMANKPSLLLADEPTGNLDPETAFLVFNELISVVKENQLSALVATHNHDITMLMDRVIRLENGELIETK